MSYRNDLSPPIFPSPWASEWGEDAYGLWQTLIFNGIRQVFRWIEPGAFMMGSPDEEPESYDYEIRRAIAIEQGLWLADTAATQALWLEFASTENPARYQDDPAYPVHGISWDDAQAFIAGLNQRIEGLHARLQTEAEWEYGCRAGTDTPFSFGANISSDMVNFNGEYPYANGPKCEFRGKPVPVKFLPANAWGLYEMHGNVWEWCQDEWEEWLNVANNIEASVPLLPIGERIARGGSWDADAKFVRSAYRFHFDKTLRSEFFGLRLALDSY